MCSEAHEVVHEVVVWGDGVKEGLDSGCFLGAGDGLCAEGDGFGRGYFWGGHGSIIA